MRYTVANDIKTLDWSAQGDARALQNIRNALRAWRGETPFWREVGLDPATQHAPATRGEALAVAEISRNIEDYVPEARVLAVRVSLPGGELRIEVDVEVNGE